LQANQEKELIQNFAGNNLKFYRLVELHHIALCVLSNGWNGWTG